MTAASDVRLRETSGGCKHWGAAAASYRRSAPEDFEGQSHEADCASCPSKVASRAEGSCCESPIHDEEGHEQGCQDSSDALPTLLASTWRQSACLDRLFLEKGPYKPRQPEGAAARSGGRRVPAPRPHHTQALEANFELSDEPLGATTSFAAASPLMPVGCPPQAGHCGPGRRHHQRHHERGHAPSRHEASAEKGVSHGRKCSAQRLE
eukprot:TRINITY_DN18297_c0_g1_i1.p1 TRINITY_DN18297_c0_g1~~TRINITY_DN18297_c0_g1_i1.p1  ORF type:complete len:208 (-),score=32.19 TRINITY_DN18297_c0_g1_i1:154-777(-)